MGKKVLVADDSVTIQKVIKLALSSEGYDILAVSEGREAVRAIMEERPDVVLIDVALPGADAYAVKRAVNENPVLANTGFVLMASAFERIDERQVDEVRFRGRLIKPFDPSHLRKAVAEAMKKPAQEAAPSAPPALEETVATSAEDLPPMGDHFKMEEVEMPGPELAEADEETPRTPHEPVAVEAQKPAVGSEQDESATIDEELREKLQAEVLENDIKDLTESTIKMSGLDEFEWSMDDSRKMKAPEPAKPAQPDITKPISVPPAASTPASTPASPPRQPPPPRFLERPDFAEPEITRPLVRGEDGSPFRNVLGATERSIDDGGSTFPLPGGPAPSTGGAKEEPNPEVPEIEISTSPTGFSPEVEHTDVRRGLAKQKQSSQAQPSRAEIEEIVRKEVRSTVEKAVRELVPQIAESVIRKEIEKLLAEP